MVTPPIDQCVFGSTEVSNHGFGSITPPSHSILHAGNAAASFFTPASVTFVNFADMETSFEQSAR